MSNRLFSIAIDGPAGAGKSTIAKKVAAEAGAKVLDTGAMYRALGVYMLRTKPDASDEEVLAMAKEADISVGFNGIDQITYLNGEDVSAAIRTDEGSMAASRVSRVGEVRKIMVARQQKIAEGISVVAEGRDICSVVLPDATLKLFLTASVTERACRRYNQQREAGKTPVFHEILDDIVERDYNDSHRAASPLTRTEDAVYLDTSDMTIKQVVDEIIRLLKERMPG